MSVAEQVRDDDERPRLVERGRRGQWLADALRHTPHGASREIRWSTSLIAAFSRARSAYMRFNFAFSTSSSRSRFTSATEAPPYFVRHFRASPLHEALTRDVGLGIMGPWARA
jgi:hypothetical protein